MSRASKRDLKSDPVPCHHCGKPSTFQMGEYIPFKAQARFYCTACFRTVLIYCPKCRRRMSEHNPEDCYPPEVES